MTTKSTKTIEITGVIIDIKSHNLVISIDKADRRAMHTLPKGTKVALVQRTDSVHYINTPTHAHSLVESADFHKWCAETSQDLGKCEEAAITFIKRACNIGGIKDLMTNEQAKSNFVAMVQEFEAWKAGQ